MPECPFPCQGVRLHARVSISMPECPSPCQSPFPCQSLRDPMATFTVNYARRQPTGAYTGARWPIADGQRRRFHLRCPRRCPSDRRLQIAIQQPPKRRLIIISILIYTSSGSMRGAVEPRQVVDIFSIIIPPSNHHPHARLHAGNMQNAMQRPKKNAAAPTPPILTNPSPPTTNRTNQSP